MQNELLSSESMCLGNVAKLSMEKENIFGNVDQVEFLQILKAEMKASKLQNSFRLQ